MKIPLIVGLAAVAVTATVAAQTVQREAPFSHNGSMWTGHEYDPGYALGYKFGYLEGYGDAVVRVFADNWAAKEAHTELDINSEGLPDKPYAATIALIDQFYSVPENQIIPIDDAIQFVKTKAAGKLSPDLLEKYRQAMIKSYRDASTGKTQ